jgi:uncharacterized iron-regulated protein
MTVIRAALVVALIATPAFSEEVSTGPGIASAAAGAQIVILGEVHDNPAHHDLQAEAVAALSPSAIVFEMLTHEEAGLVTPELARDAAALEDALDWEASGWPDFAMYYPLLAFAAGGPILGAEVPREAAQGAFSEGAAAVFAGDAARFGLHAALPEAEQAAREAEQLAAHCDALPPEILPGFVEAQRLRDAALAAAALSALEEHGAPVVVITGNGHARRDWGMPAVLAVAAPEVAVLSLGQFEAAPEGEVPFDLWSVAAPIDRPDPCAAFR